MSENTKPRKRLIVKLSYPPGSRKRDSDSCGTDENKRRKIQDSVRPTVTCYWVDSNYRTKTTPLSQPKDNNIAVENKNQVSNTLMSQPKDSNIIVENKEMIENQVSNTVMSQPKDSNIAVENKKMIKNQVTNTVMSQPKAVENKKMIKNQFSKTEIDFNGQKESSRLCTKTASVTRPEECTLKKPMDCIKRRECWLILKRMLVGRDGWDLKDPPMRAMVDKSKAIGLKEIERKMRLYATPGEFASDMRLVFSNAMLMYPPRHHIYQIAKKFSDNFEHKWKSLKATWKLEDRKRRRLTNML
ncbi:unnamed protein product [Vicia faba]|uniref:Bromo domain-containing protein n=1 Tax=Vicia faba TaxID=3906 RepID=A0AAV0YQG5_VICFA|nr:unnamed protein product [Vicia faba]CAI8587707.1 unnamed protein product [Vicia faba]CAI8587709.1 unnamed protein product [Vicia faba]CAI8587711.1 unnamed protein product [Vicia faba]